MLGDFSHNLRLALTDAYCNQRPVSTHVVERPSGLLSSMRLDCRSFSGNLADLSTSHRHTSIRDTHLGGFF